MHGKSGPSAFWREQSCPTTPSCPAGALMPMPLALAVPVVAPAVRDPVAAPARAAPPVLDAAAAVCPPTADAATSAPGAVVGVVPAAPASAPLPALALTPANGLDRSGLFVGAMVSTRVTASAMPMNGAHRL